MPEKTITLEGVEPLAFYGVANANLNRICDLFPKLKIVARGSSIKAIGDEAELERFQEKMQALMAYSSKYGHISPEVVGQVFSEGLHKAEEAQSKDTIVYGNGGLIVKARTVNQQRLVELYDDNDLLFAVGPAGSGKTYTAIALAVRALRNKEVKRIILTRPAVEAGEKLGFLPGDLKEKLDPYLQPLYDALNDMIPAAKLQKYIDEGAVQSFTFGPLLVNDGEAVELPEKYIISTKDTIREPRTAIGQVDANHYVLVVADGRRDGWSDKGMTLQELQQVFVEQGCKVAYNLDGGGSATMILGSQRVNKTSGSRERDVSDIVYFTK